MEQNELENEIYASIIGECEQLEASKVYTGNGHHLAQRLTAKILQSLTARKGRSTFELAKKLFEIQHSADKVKGKIIVYKEEDILKLLYELIHWDG